MLSPSSDVNPCHSLFFDRDHLQSGIKCGPIWGSFAVLGSFADPYRLLFFSSEPSFFSSEPSFFLSTTSFFIRDFFFYPRILFFYPRLLFLSIRDFFRFIRDFFFYPRLLFFIRDFFFLSATSFFYPRLLFLSATFFFHPRLLFLTATSFFYPRLLFLSANSFCYPRLFFIRDFCFACAKTAGSLILNRAGPRAGNMAAAMAGEDREEEEQGAIRKINMLSYLWYQFIGKKISKYLMSNQLKRYTHYL